MNLQFLQWLGALWAICLWAAAQIWYFRVSSHPSFLGWESWGITAIAGIALLFWLLVSQISRNQDREVQRRTQQLESLHSAALTLTTELRLSTVLQKVIDLSRTLVGARYGALGVLDSEGRQIGQFITSGISEGQRSHMGHLPQGLGLLGLLIGEKRGMRVNHISAHPSSVGFPPNHPSMSTFMGVPISSKGKVIGNIYVTDKIQPGQEGDPAPFTDQDQEILEMFATQAAIAIENAQLYRQTQELAVLQERERFSMDLHDGIIQSIYAIGLTLEDGLYYIESAPSETASRITQTIAGLNEVIRDIRNYILDLRPQRFQGRDLVRGINELGRELRANTLFGLDIESEGVDPALLPAEHTVEILHIVQEALTNIRKHARPTRVRICTVIQNGSLLVTIDDDGIGFDPRKESGRGNGLYNMQERAQAINGSLQILTNPQGGARVELLVPLP